MALVLNGSGSITGLSAGGLPDGSVTADDIASTLDLSGKTVTLPAGTGGKVLQVVQGTITNDVTTSSNTRVATGLKATITPSSSSNKVLMMFHATGTLNSTIHGLEVDLYRNGSVIAEQLVHADGYDSNAAIKYVHPAAMYLDSPNTTSSLEYELYFASNSSGSTTFGTSAKPCHIILMEIAA
jgi:hypothetical protein